MTRSSTLSAASPTHVIASAGERGCFEREWLLTNGTGAYAMGTVAGVNTRRYHGLLVAASQPPVQRQLLLNQMFEQLRWLTPAGDWQRLDFSSFLFRGGDGDPCVNPPGHQRLEQFERGTAVTWTYAWQGIRFRRTLHLHWKQQAATLHYQLSGVPAYDGQVILRLQPMLTLRDFHGLLRSDHPSGFGVQVDPDERTVRVRSGDHQLTLRCEGAQGWHGGFEERHDWWYGLYYPVDHRRGQDDREDYFVPGAYDWVLPSGETGAELWLTAALGAEAPPAVRGREGHAAILEKMATALEPIAALPGVPDGPRLVRTLAIACNDFVVERTLEGRTLATILAGYPWFADWGRDTFISLEGLLLCSGRHEEARAVMDVFSRAIRHGLIPNRFDDYGAPPHYNTVDAALWFVHAALRYRAWSGDVQAWSDWLGAACMQVLDAYADGTDHEIYMDTDGLISAGHAGTQLTWMDAAAVAPGASELTVFTPRWGKAVEINALWYNALRGVAEALPAGDRNAGRYQALADQVQLSFGQVFWNPESGCLFDHVYFGVDGSLQQDAAIRPNQVFACSLPYSPLPQEQRREVLRMLMGRLLTPAGLRTLPEDDPAFHPFYGGIAYRRDEAYHQGTIWPWLIGPFAEGLFRAEGESDAARRQALQVLQPLLDQLLTESPQSRAAVGHLHEIHQAQTDGGDPTHPPRGCPAQAWSVAEVTRVLCVLTGRVPPLGG